MSTDTLQQPIPVLDLGVQPDAPNATPGYHCTDEYDEMCYDDGSGSSMRSICPTCAAKRQMRSQSMA